jgi:O-acetyl-ADP-ribose deacetylase (regulator of RNase III)
LQYAGRDVHDFASAKGEEFMARVMVIDGDITTVKADALITACNSQNVGENGVDAAIRSLAGSMFHDQIAASAPLMGCSAIIARGQKHPGKFNDVIFVVDDFKRPLRAVIKSGLVAADMAGYSHVSIPAIRMGAMIGIVEQTPAEAINEIAMGVNEFSAGEPASVQDISFVIHNNATLERALRTALFTLAPPLPR